MDLADFGRYLSQQRELRGLSRDEVANVTKIPVTLIAALESGEAERMPGRVFVLNYIRAYALVIGLAPEEALLRYQEIHRERGEPLPSVLERARRRRALLTLAGVSVGLAVAGYVLLAVSGRVPLPFVGH